jgi:hypothetical protein
MPAQSRSSARRCIAAVQSSYVPWKGYFDLVRQADEFVLYDDVQFTRRDWRNRNRIKTAQGLQWLTVPVESKGNYLQPIRDVTISDPAWNHRHLKALRLAYGRTPHFRTYQEWLEDLYGRATHRRLSAINHHFLTAICQVLGIDTPISWSMDYELPEGRSERLVALCRQAGATEYLTGPSARDYIDEGLFAAEGIQVRYIDYSGYREYPQQHPPFEHRVSVLDLILNVGPAAPEYLSTAWSSPS